MRRGKYICLLAACLMFGTGTAVSGAENGTEALAESEKLQEEQVASANEMAAIQEVVKEWMVPIRPDELEDGEYKIEVDSSSAMFSVEECTLTVSDGKMTALMTMGGKGYLKVFMGTGEEAVQAADEEYISFVEAADGRHTFELPVEALDCGISCSAFSKSREKWYDRTLVFLSSSLPLDAFKNPKMVTAADLNLEDGSYTAEVSLEGGSGKTKVESPANLYVEDGKIMAEIVFGSANYDYVIVEGEKYSLLNEEGNSSFFIPVVGFDCGFTITADSIALGKPREIDYRIRFDSSAVQRR